jgi:assimilatory nitrate reductase catalytic subunit
MEADQTLAHAALHATPLWPAGHLPRKGGDRMSRLSSSIAEFIRMPPAQLPISPLAGEMAGRPEGGVTERKLSVLARSILP